MVVVSRILLGAGQDHDLKHKTHFGCHLETFGIGNKIKASGFDTYNSFTLPSNHPVGWPGLGWYYPVDK